MMLRIILNQESGQVLRQICVDIGNTNAVIGLWDRAWHSVLRIESGNSGLAQLSLDLKKCLAELEILPGPVQIILSSVVPRLTDLVHERLSEHFIESEVVLISPDLMHKPGLNFPVPGEVGGDLIANAFGATRLYVTDCLIVDFGTALTFMLASQHAGILGASIAPGIRTALKSLNENTALLPEVPLEFPLHVAGTNTIEAIQSGTILGYYGLVSHLIRLYQEAYGRHLQVVATGGLTHVLHQFYDLFDHVNPTLTLDGLRLIGEVLREDQDSP